MLASYLEQVERHCAVAQTPGWNVYKQPYVPTRPPALLFQALLDENIQEYREEGYRLVGAELTSQPPRRVHPRLAAAEPLFKFGRLGFWTAIPAASPRSGPPSPVP